MNRIVFDTLCSIQCSIQGRSSMPCVRDQLHGMVGGFLFVCRVVANFGVYLKALASASIVRFCTSHRFRSVPSHPFSQDVY